MQGSDSIHMLKILKVGVTVHSYIIRRTPHEIYPDPNGKTGAEYVFTAISHSNYLIFSGFILRASILWTTVFGGILNSESVISELK